MNEHIHIFALGGLDEEGKNLYVVEINGDIFVIEAGIKYPDRNTPGIDYIIPDYSYLKENKENIKGYFISHGHDDVLGALAYIYPSAPAPVYCSETTKIFIEGFLKHTNAEVKINYKIVKPSDDIEIEGRKISFFSVCHSMPQAFGMSIETSDGNIVYCGDFINENGSFANFNFDKTQMSKIIKNKTLLLMCESIYSSRPGYTTPNHRLSSEISNIFDVETANKIFIAANADNAFAIAEILQLAKQYRRKIVFYDEETKTTIKSLENIEECSLLPKNIINLDDVNRVNSSEVLVLILGYNERLYKKINKIANRKTNINFTSNDTFICTVPAKARYEVVSARTLDNLYRSGLKVFSVSKKEHLSMHPSEEDIKSMIYFFKPKYYVPIKGRYINLIDNAMLAYKMSINLSHNNIFVIENGTVIDINGGIARILPNSMNVKTGIVLIDGLNQTSQATKICKERLRLGHDGCVVLNATVSKKECKIISDIHIDFIGVSFSKEYKNISQTLNKEFQTILDENLLGNFQLYNVEVIIEEKIGRIIKRDTGKEPLIMSAINVI